MKEKAPMVVGDGLDDECATIYLSRNEKTPRHINVFWVVISSGVRKDWF
jgi:hypothetical protein